MAQSITDAEFQTEVLKANMPVLVDFWASWCGPCKAMLPVIEELSSEYEGKVKVVKMNIDENMETAGKYSIMSIPTFMIFKNGEPIATLVGVKSKEDMRREMDEAMK